jgi:hypothetical protein
MIALRLDIVAHPGLGRDQRARVRAPLFPVGTALHFANGGVESRDPFRDDRGIVGQLDQFVAADAEVGEHRIGEDLAQLRGAAGVAALRGKRLHIDVERLGEAQQYARRHRPLVAFEVIEIGARDAELVGHLALVEPALTPQPLEPRAEEELALNHHL